MSKACEMCGDPATVLCLECSKYLCDECSTVVHKRERNKLHKIEAISKTLTVDTKCPEHKEHPLEYFCEDDYGKNTTTYA